MMGMAGTWRGWLWPVVAVAWLLPAVGCAPPVPRPRPAATVDNGTEVDTGCSYFYFLWGKSAEYRGSDHYDEALEAFEKALVCDPTATRVMRNLVRLLIQMDRKHQAVHWLEKLIARQPDDMRLYSLLANVYGAMGKDNQAVAALEDGLRRQPDNQQLMLLLGSLYGRIKAFGKAEKVLQRLITQDPTDPMGHRYLAKLYRRMGLIEKALAQYRATLDLEWSTALAAEAAGLAERQQLFQAAADFYRRILDQDAGHEQARFRLAAMEMRLGRLDAAIAELEALQRRVDNPIPLQLAIGRLLLEQHHDAKARQYLAKVLRRHPELGPLPVLLAGILQEMGQEERALAELAAVDRQDPAYVDAFQARIYLLMRLKEFGRAEQLLQREMEHASLPRRRLQLQLAALYADRQPERARGLYQQLLAEDPEDGELLFAYGMFLDRRGESAAAMATMQRLLALDAENPFALNYIGYSWADSGQHLDQALSYTRKAVALRPEDGFIRDSLGWTYYRLEQFDRAVETLQQAVELEPEDPTILTHLGDALVAAGRHEEARGIYQRALQLVQKQKQREQLEKKLQELDR